MPARNRNVCVLIAAMNAEATIARAVQSALAEPESAEVVVVDDASSDRTSAAAEAEDDGSGRLRILKLPRNVGPAAARNAGLAASSAPLIALLDADDYLMPGRTARLLAAARCPWDFLADDILIVPEEQADQPLNLAFLDPGRVATTLELAAFVFGNLSHHTRPRSELGFLKPIVRRAWLDRHALRYDEHLRLGEDYALYVRALAAGARFVTVGVCGYVAIERAGSLSDRHTASDLERIADVDLRLIAELGPYASDARSALRRHRSQTLAKAVHRRVIDTRRGAGLLAALSMMARHPSALPHVTLESLRARTIRWKLAAPPERPIRALLNARRISPLPKDTNDDNRVAR